MTDRTLLAANIRQTAHIEELEKELARLRRFRNLYAANARIAELEAQVAWSAARIAELEGAKK
jgi:uncharacterized coiled-coil protein SlyX